MKILKTLIWAMSFALLGGILNSCQKRDPIHTIDSRVNFWILQDTITNTGSKVYTTAFSFATLSDEVMMDTINIRVKIMGAITSADRVFTAKPIEGTTAVADTDYVILNGIIPSNQYIGYLPIVVKRTAELKTTTRYLVLELADNGVFKPGVNEDKNFTVYFNDGLVMPSNWNVLATYFGTYSEVKYKFVIQVSGRADFPVTTTSYKEGQLTHYQMLDLKNLIKDALAEYNNTHATPLRDEFNALVTIP